MIEFSSSLLKKTFRAETTKEAFLKASKWVANHILANGLDASVKYKDVSDLNIRAIEINVFVTMPVNKVMERHCKICEETRKVFLMGQGSIMCTECKVKAYDRRMKDTIKVKQEYTKEQIIKRRREDD